MSGEMRVWYLWPDTDICFRMILIIPINYSDQSDKVRAALGSSSPEVPVYVRRSGSSSTL